MNNDEFPIQYRLQNPILIGEVPDHRKDRLLFTNGKVYKIKAGLRESDILDILSQIENEK